MPVSPLLATQTPTPNVIPISDGSGKLNAWVDNVDIQAALDAISNVQGSVLFRGASAWQALGPGVPGGFLMTNGSGADVSWSLGSGIYDAWVAAVDAAGGTYETDSKTICSDLADQLQLATFFSKLVYFMPLLGANLAAGLVPLIDTLGVGSPVNTAFVDADFDQAFGLQGNGSTKYLDSLIKPIQLGSGSNGGLGWLENNMTLSGNVEPLGTYQSGAALQRFVLDFRSNPFKAFRWGTAANAALDNTTPTNGHYYGQRSSSVLRELYFNGSLLVSNTTSDAATGANSTNMIICGARDETGTIFPWPGRCAAVYLTNGALSAGEIADLDTLLQTYLITPTGRP